MPNSFLLHFLPYALLSLLLAGAAILFCDTVGSRLRSRTCFLLLLFLCVRIVIPTGFSPISLFHIPTNEAESMMEEAPPKDQTVGADTPMIPSPNLPSYPVDTEENGSSTSPVVPLPNTSPQERPTEPMKKAPIDVWRLVNDIAFSIWIIGALICFLALFLPGMIARKRLRKHCVAVTEERRLQIYSAVCTDVWLRRPPALCQSTAVHSPYLCGILTPRIILPCSSDASFSSSELEILLRHEVQHARHKDLLIKYLINLCLAVQWWNPLLFLLAKRMSFYIEAACDESVLHGRDPEFRLQYTTLLAKLARGRDEKKSMHYAPEAGFAKHQGHAVLRRVQNLLNDAPRKRGGTVTLAVLLLCISTFFLYGFAPTVASTPNGGQDAAIITEEDTTGQSTPSDTTDKETTYENETETSPEETTVPDKEDQPQEASVFVFRKMAGVNFYELSGVKDRSIVEAIVPSHYCGAMVARVAEYAFADCEQLTRVVIPDTVKDIGDGAFLRCTSLRDITLSSNLYSIGTAAFRECTALERIEIPGGVMTLQSETFYRCTSLHSVTLSNGLQQIQSRAFDGNSALTQLTIPASVWMMNVEAIKNCATLSNISYAGSIEQWQKIMKRTEIRNGVTVGWCSDIATAVIQCADATVNIQE